MRMFGLARKISFRVFYPSSSNVFVHFSVAKPNMRIYDVPFINIHNECFTVVSSYSHVINIVDDVERKQ
jgi:hypothetical protein